MENTTKEEEEFSTNSRSLDRVLFPFLKNQARRVSHVPGSSVTRNNWGSTRLHVRPGDARAFLRVGLAFDGRPLIVNRDA